MNVLYLGEESLRKVSEPVEDINDELRTLVREMFITMDADRGIGLAAPQIGKNIRLFIVKIDDGIERIFINPQIIATSEEQCSYEEGCLSIPELYAPVVRPESITIQYKDINNRRKTLEADGLLARVIQHEYDHLEGVLFIDRLPEKEKNDMIEKFTRIRQRKAKREAKKRIAI